MKKFLFIIVFISIASGSFYYWRISECQKPISYDIGNFDSRFELSKDKFIKTSKEAEDIWEKGTGKELFIYQPGSSFKINLVFDERQSATIEANVSKKGIENSRAQYDSMTIDYKIITSNYEKALGEYDSDVAAFEIKLKNYNLEVSRLNKGGGATPKEYKNLEEVRMSLEKEKTALNIRARDLNLTAKEINDLGNRINSLASDLNITVDIHNQRFGEAKEFDQGDYTGGEINIYQYNGLSDLRLVLAHELGHAIGIDHVENPESIMYYLMDKQNLSNPSLSIEDRVAFLDRCKITNFPYLNF